ncbi:RagB/SusD family nutrient uptake outer membrane protein [Mucilaginibacter sp.]|uniref:RagB/SusD family nutrient uptake outer membrane protein n=1 Tax=Mucilaginibacter sp. TaxID=1882438 RepID=UPI00356173A8
MKNLKRYNHIALKASLLSLMMLASVSCTKNLLDPTVITFISQDVAFDTPERIVAQINGLYSSIKSGQFFGGRLFIYNELRADEFIMNKPNIVTGQNTWLQSVGSSTSEVTGLWSAGYSTINQVNTFLAGLELNKSKITDAQYNNYAGEAKFLRALSYFALIQTYAQPYIKDNGGSMGLPLRLLAEKSTENNSLARSSVAQIYDQILSDLNAAEAGLPLTYTTAALNTTRAHRNTAISLKTRVYMVMGKYADVVTEAKKIVSTTAPFQAATGVNNKLEANVATVFGGSYAGSESVFSLPFTATETPGTQNQLAYYFNIAPGNAEFFLNQSATLADPVYATASADARKGFILTQTGQKWLTKYKVAATFSDWIPVIRYAEVMLNYAEAAARTGDLTTATALVNAVRKRSDATYTFPATGTATQAALINTILQEKKIEFLGEGFRVPDLQRLLQTLPAKSSTTNSAPAVAAAESRYIWPISSAEISTNPLLIQNP